MKRFALQLMDAVHMDYVLRPDLEPRFAAFNKMQRIHRDFLSMLLSHSTCIRQRVAADGLLICFTRIFRWKIYIYRICISVYRRVYLSED